MKSNLSYLLVFCFFFAACKKESTIQKQNDLAVSNKKDTKSFSISAEDYSLLTKALANHANVDSLMKVIAARSEYSAGQQGRSLTSSKIKNNDVRMLDVSDTTALDIDPSGDYMASSGDASGYAVNPYIEGENPFVNSEVYGARVFTNYITMTGFFSMRGNTIQIVLPFSYVPYGGGVYIDNNTPSEKQHINIIGPAIGTLDPASRYQSTNIYNPDQHLKAVNGNSSGGIVENRVRSKTSTGEFKFTLNGEVVGSEISAGVTIVSQLNSTSSYTYNSTFHIDNNDSSALTPVITYNLWAYCLGIQEN